MASKVHANRFAALNDDYEVQMPCKSVLKPRVVQHVCSTSDSSWDPSKEKSVMLTLLTTEALNAMCMHQKQSCYDFLSSDCTSPFSANFHNPLVHPNYLNVKSRILRSFSPHFNETLKRNGLRFFMNAAPEGTVRLGFFRN